MLFSGNLIGSHFMGLDVFYQRIGTDTLRIWVQWYKDCRGSAFCLTDQPPGCGGCECMDINFTYFPSGCGPIVPLGPWVQVLSQEEVTPICASAVTSCSDPSSSMKGVYKAAYYRDFDVSNVTCDSIRIELESCCRNASIGNINGASSASLYGEVMVNLSVGVNSSPFFAQDPIPFMCLNQPAIFFQGATDPDGDSLSYSFGPCLDAGGVPLSYAAPYSPSNPMPSNPPLFLDPVTGNLYAHPTQVFDAVVCIYITEWRNGVPIGRVMRDMQITVLDCGTQQVPVIAGLDSTYAYGDTVCTSMDTIQYYIPIIDTNYADNIVVSWVNLPPGANMTYNSTTQTLYFTWPNPVPSNAPYNFTVFVNDNACPINGISQVTFSLSVKNGRVEFEDTVVVNCNEATFSVLPTLGVPPFTYLWTGAGLDTTGQNTNPTLTHTYNTSGTYTYYVEVTDNYGCSAKDTGQFTINVTAPDMSFNKSNDWACLGDSIEFYYVDTLPPGTIYTWDFGYSAIPSSYTGPGPVKVTWLTSGIKYVTLTANINGCLYSHTDSVDIREKPIVDAGSDISICAFSGIVTLNGTVVGNSCSYQWTPSLGLSNSGILNPVVFVDTTTTFYLTANCNGCSATDSVIVKILERPVVWADTPLVYYCTGTAGVELPGNVSGGTPPYTFEWIPAYALSNPYVLRPRAFPAVDTSYKLVAVDKYGCSSDTVEVFVKPVPIPIAYAGKDTSICEGGPGIFLQGGVLNPGFESYSYEWIPHDGLNNPYVPNPYALPDSTTIYTLIVTTNQSKCSSDPLDTNATVVVKVVPKPIAEAGPPEVEICYKDSIQIGDIGQGVDTNYVYQWSPTDGLSDPTSYAPFAGPLHTTTYFLQVFNGGCASDVDSITVIVKPHPEGTIDQPAYEICKGDTAQMSATFSLLPQGYNVYTVWKPDAWIIGDSTLNPKAFPKDTTIYYFMGSIEGCPPVMLDSTIVIVKPSPIVYADSVLNRPDTIIVCKGDTFQLPAKIISPEPYSFYWTPTTWMITPNEVNALVAPQENITYYLTAIYGTCSDMDSIYLAVEGGYDVKLSADSSYVCEGDTVTLTAVGGRGFGTFIWRPEVISTVRIDSITEQAIAVPTDTTTYIVELIEGHPKCSAKDSVTIVFYGKAVADFTFSTDAGCDTLKVSFKDKSKNAITYLWDFGDGSISNVKNPVHIYTSPGIYNVTLIINSQSPCPGEHTSTKQIIVKPPITFNVTYEPKEDTLYLPNSTVKFIYDDSNSLNNAVSWYWSFGDGYTSEEKNPVHTYESEGTYRVVLVVYDDKGCAYEKTIGVITVIRPDVEVPNVFTPNGDGINDYLQFVYEGDEPFEAFVYDRWGNLVFSTNSSAKVWDGTVDGKDAPEGTYFYVVKVNKSVYRGSITLIR